MEWQRNIYDELEWSNWKLYYTEAEQWVAQNGMLHLINHKTEKKAIQSAEECQQCWDNMNRQSKKGTYYG